MTRGKVAFVHGLEQAVLDWILSRVPDDFAVTPVPGKQPQEALARAVADADYLMVYRALLPDAVLRAAHRVRLIQILAAGYDEFNLALMRELNLACAQNAGANADAVADYTVLLMLALFRRLAEADRATRDGRWRQPITGLNTYEMDGKLVGLIGIGSIGRKVARRVQGFGARVQYAYHREQSPLSPDEERAAGLVRVPLGDLFRTSDIITVHVPRTPQTMRMIGGEALAQMKPTAILINTSRGDLIEEEALVQALRTGVIAGAGLDVFTSEPVDTGNPLLALPNVLVSPHVAGTTVDTWARRLDFAFANMRRAREGQPILGLVTA